MPSPQEKMSSVPIDSLHSVSSQNAFLPVVAAVLEAVSNSGTSEAPSVYDASAVPTIKLHDYLRRWVRYTRCPAICVVSAVMLVDRVCVYTGLVVNPLNVHRLLLAALVVSCKWSLDRPFRNSCYSKVGGVSTAAIGELERQLLIDLDWDVGINAAELEEYESIFRGHRMWPIRTPGPTRRPSPATTPSTTTETGPDNISTLPPTESSYNANSETHCDVPALATDRTETPTSESGGYQFRRSKVGIPTPPETERGGTRPDGRNGQNIVPMPPCSSPPSKSGGRRPTPVHAVTPGCMD